jgi:hypothetical protein
LILFCFSLKKLSDKRWLRSGLKKRQKLEMDRFLHGFVDQFNSYEDGELFAKRFKRVA